MDVREAVKRAKEAIVTIFEDEEPWNLRLEEITFTNGPPTWNVTISFERQGLGFGNSRTFKVVHLDDPKGEVRSVTHRVLPAV